MWDEQELESYKYNTLIGVGQVGNDSFSQEITKLCSDRSNKFFLEIGTWNGLGSTKYFINELSKRDDDYVFFSLECNSDKSNEAKNLYKNKDPNKIKILNEVIWNNEPSNFYEVFPQCLSDELYKKWNDIDIINMKKCPLFLHRSNLPDIFDVLMLDGGEFTTYYEFQLLKDRCKYLLLDDINVAKCQKIVEEIKNEPNKWKILIENKDERHGYLVALCIF